MTQALDPSLLEKFKQLLAERTGLIFPERDLSKLESAFSERLGALKLPQLADYYQLLWPKTVESKREIAKLAELLVNKESYFFRDEKQFHLLRSHLLPALIQRYQARKTLKIWSAGCSAGEELFSVAMLLLVLLPTYKEWKLILIGTDISEQAILQAQTGIYQERALRSIPSEMCNRFFTRIPEGWRIDERLRGLASFFQHNLALDPFPDRAYNLYEVDLIICRNVFIYFDRQVISRVVDGFYKTLTNGGYLLTGHGELYDQTNLPFHKELLEGSMIYQKLPEHLNLSRY